MNDFEKILRENDLSAACALLGDPEIAALLNTACLAFGMPPLAAARSREMADLMLEKGADLSRRS